MNLKSVFIGALNTKACQIFLQACHISLFHKKMLKMQCHKTTGTLSYPKSGQRGHELRGKKLRINSTKDFPSSLVAKTPHFQYRSLCSIPGQGTRSHMLQQQIPRVAMKIKDPVCLNSDPAQPNVFFFLILK